MSWEEGILVEEIPTAARKAWINSDEMSYI